MIIYIQSSTSTIRNYELNVEPSTTVRQLKEYIRQKTRDDEEHAKKIVITFDKDVLDADEAELPSYGIEDESQLYLSYSNTHMRNFDSLGIKFVDVSNRKGLKRCEWSKAAPDWRKCRCGLNLVGRCTNNECKAYNHMVIIPIGYKRFDVLCDTDATTTICPICKEYVAPESCGFNNCWWRFEGKKVETDSVNKPPRKCSCDWTQADDAFHYFDETISGTVGWLKLIIEAVKKDPKK